VNIGCVNIRGWGVGKMVDICEEMENRDMDIMGLVETQLRERVKDDHAKYSMLAKGRTLQVRKGGGVAILVRKDKEIEVVEVNMGEDSASEDIIGVRCEFKSGKNKIKKLYMFVCYMTTEGGNARNENNRKYNILKREIEKIKDEQVIVMGDMNGHIGMLGEEVNANGERLLGFAEAMQLEILNQTIAEGSVTWSVRDRESAIDYILVNERARGKVRSMKIDEEGEWDLNSDHNVMSLKYECGGKVEQRTDVTRKKRNRWKLRGANWDNFQVELGEAEWNGTYGVEELSSCLEKNIKKAATKKIGYVRMKRGKRVGKAWWNDDIKERRNERKVSNRACRRMRAQRKRGIEVSNEEYLTEYNEYLSNKNKVRNLIHSAMSDDDKRVVDELRRKGEEGGKEWYRFLRGENTESFNVNELVVNGESITDKKEMARVTERFWKEIGSMHEDMNEVDVNLTLERKELDDMNEEPQLEEVRRVVVRLRNDKAAGLDDIPYEMYKFGGEIMIKKLHELFIEIWKDERVPCKWNESKVVLLHKGGGKNRKELKNYRPISLTNTVGKIFCMLMNERVRENIEKHKVMGEEQNGFRMKRRGEDNMFVVREVIERLKKEGKKGYFAFLDIEKAYDRVDREVLYRVLERCGFSEKIVRIVKSMYVDTKAKFNLGDIETDWVSSERGVRQGCILSPLLFGLYTEELAVRVNRCGEGIRVGNDRLNVLLYADDVVVMTENRNSLQRVFDVISQYAREFRVRFSAEKSQVLVVNGSVEDDGLMWKLGGKDISRTNEYKYLGMWVDENGCERSKREKMSKAQQWYGRLGSVAKTRANKYEVVRGLWKGVAVPSLMYGMNVLKVSPSECDKLDVVQNRVGRVALGANGYVGVEAIRGDVGWSTFRERVMKSCLNYKIRLERMDSERWARKVYEWNSGKSKWEAGCRALVNKCGYQKVNRQMYEDGGVGWMIVNERGSGYEWDEIRWKAVIDSKVKEVGKEKWKNGIRSKETLEWYVGKERPKCEKWYDGSWGSQLLFKARSQSLEVNARTHRWNVSRSKICEVCDLNEEETVVHVLVECSRYESERARLLRILEIEVGRMEMNQWFARDDRGVKVVLGFEKGMNKKAMDGMKIFLSEVWAKRGKSLAEREIRGGQV
jgi:hypothetical protein